MAGFADTLRGDGLARAQRALAGLEGDPQRLDRARVRFDDSPPPYTSDRSGTTTRSQSPDPPSQEQRQHQERRVQLGLEAEASKPREQFSAQVREERERLWDADPRRSGIRPIAIGGSVDKMAHENVKKSWVEQGIWNNKWNKFASGRWKHEEPLELESESETASEAESSRSLFALSPKEPQRKPKRPKSDEEKRRFAERRIIREREREASRPYHQFVYQISMERERIQDESGSAKGAGVGNADINTAAYENVKNTWTKRGIWNKRWGILPGMSWKHEEPLEEETADGTAPQVNLVENGSHEVREAPIITMNGAPLRNIFGHPITNVSESGIPSIVESNHQGPSAEIGSVGLESGDAERSPSAPNSPRLQTDKRVLRPTTGQASGPGRRKPSDKEGQPHLVPGISLGPIHPSKVSKGASMKKPGPQRPRISENVSSSGLPLSSGMGTAETPVREAPRRSNRIQQLVPGVTKDPTRTVATNPSKRAVRSKPQRKGATRSSAKPQGISKSQRAKTTPEKVRKE